jgi:CBS domain containing-hemolysin-like protein
MMMDNALLILLMLILSAFFSGMEIAFISSNRLRIELEKKQGLFASRIIAVFVSHPSKFLTTMLIGNNIALVIYSILMASIIEPAVKLYIGSPILVLFIQTIFATLIILATGEFLPKVVFSTIPNLTLNIFAIPGLFFYTLFYPISSFIVIISNSIIKKIHGSEEPDIKAKHVFNKVDLVHLIDISQQEELEESGSDNDLKLFQNALDFSTVKVRDCMVPRTEITALEVNSPVEELHQKFIETGFSKILIYKDNIDNMVGYITSKSIFKQIKTISEKLIDISFIPEAMPANRLLEKFIQEKKSVSVVVDEFGGVSGMVTIEDIIEEIFGEIEDEHDIPELVEKQISDSEFIFSGRLEIDYLNEKYNLNIPDSEDYETLAGFIFQHYESIPKLNAQIQIYPYSFRILKATKTKIDLVQLMKIS